MFSTQQPKDLPPNLVNQYKSIFKNFDLKLWKQCFKACDVILKAHPTHGETWALKALVTYSTDKKKEANMLVRKALRFDVKSGLAWDVLSFFHRSEKLHHQAAKYSTLAHISLPTNEQIMKDLINCHVLNREFAALQKISGDFLFSSQDDRQTKHKMIGYGFSSYLAGDYKTAVGITEAYINATKKGIIYDRFEMSEILFFKATVIEKSGDVQGALTFLNSVDSDITDRESLKLKRAYFYEKLGKKEEASKEWEDLIATNPDNFSFHLSYLKLKEILPACQKSLFTPLKLDDDKRDQLIAIYDNFAKKYPRSKCCRQIPFPFLDGELFKSKFTPFLCQAISKGEMTVIKCYKNLYSDPTKVALIQEVLLNLKQLVETNQPFPGQTELEVPSSILLIKYILSQHYCKLKQHKLAMQYCEECIQHSPTVLDLYIQKGIILKDGGDAVAAATSIEEARLLDLADRYLYTKAARFFLRADNIAEARRVESVYTKVECDVNTNTVEEMQVTWYLQEEGESFKRQKMYGKALRRFYDVYNIYVEHAQDQMDFHFWCLRKATLRQYEQLINLEDRMFGDKICRSAMVRIVETYLEIFDNQAQVNEAVEKEKALVKKDDGKKKPRKEDPDGLKLVGLGLNEAADFVTRLIKFSPTIISTHLLAFEVAFRQQKYDQAVKALVNAFEIDSSNIQLNRQIVTFFNTKESQTFESEKTQLLKGAKSLEEFNKNFFEANQGQIKARLTYFESASLLGQSVDKSLLMDTTNFNLQDCVEVYNYLEQSDKGLAQEYKVKCQELLPFAVCFKDQVIETTPVVIQTTPIEEIGAGEKTG